MNKTVLITGASRGIGYCTAELFALNGLNMAVNYLHTPEPAISLSKQYGNVLPIKADVSKRHEVEAMTEQICREFGKIDVLVNNAGIAQQKLFTDITDDDWNQMFDINVKGVFHCCQAVLPGMIARKSGKIINISSVWGEKGASCEVHYSASKAALIGLTKALAKEEGLSGITVNCITPGVIDTDMNGHLNAETLSALQEETPLGRIGTPQDVAHMIYFLASDAANFITGQVIGVNGGFAE